MENHKKFTIFAALMVIIITLIFLRFFIFKSSPEDQRSPEIVQEISGTKESEKRPEDKKPENETESNESIPDLRLDESDEFIRSTFKNIFKENDISGILKINDILLRFTAAVDNISRGISPAKNLDFLEPFPEFIPGKNMEKYYLQRSSFKRYSKYVEIFSGFDSTGLIKIYRMSRKMIDKAWSKLGYSGTEFEDSLFEAIRVLVTTPIPKKSEKLFLKKKIITYKFENFDYESLNMAQKHFLRMGPENMRKVKTKLIEIAKLLGFKLN